MMTLDAHPFHTESTIRIQGTKPHTLEPETQNNMVSIMHSGQSGKGIFNLAGLNHKSRDKIIWMRLDVRKTIDKVELA